MFANPGLLSQSADYRTREKDRWRASRCKYWNVEFISMRHSLAELDAVHLVDLGVV